MYKEVALAQAASENVVMVKAAEATLTSKAKANNLTSIVVMVVVERKE